MTGGNPRIDMSRLLKLNVIKPKPEEKVVIRKCVNVNVFLYFPLSERFEIHVRLVFS